MTAPTCPKKSLHNLLVFDVRDWSEGKSDAWLYGVVVGWGDAIHDVAKRHRWDSDTVARLNELHVAFAALEVRT